MHLNTLEIILGIILLVLGVALIVVISMQHSKKSGLGAIMGGSSDSYYGRNKARTKENILKKLTIIFSIALAVLALVLYAYHGSSDGSKNNSSSVESSAVESSAVESSAVVSGDSSAVSEEASETSEEISTESSEEASENASDGE